MLQECRLAMQITDTDFDPELCLLMDAGARDLAIGGVVLPGTVSFEATNKGMQDNSTLTDPLVIRAILTYVRMNFESPADYDRLAKSYSLQKEQLMHATGYTDYGEEPEPEPEGDGDGE